MRHGRTIGILIVLILVLGVIFGGCGGIGYKTMRDIVDHKFDSSRFSFRLFGWCTKGLPFVGNLNNILGKKYVIVLQNNYELRPSGGFMGSYAVVDTDSRGIKDIRVSDIYEPDGQLPGHVEPPYPIQEAFGQGWWKLRDANWDLDFATASGAIKWFFEQGGEANVEGIVALNQTTINKIISIFGPIKLATYDEVVTENNFYQLAQKYAETRSDNNRTEKSGFLGAVGVVLEQSIKHASISNLLKLAKLAMTDLKKGEILVWMKDGELQKEIEFRNWGGRLNAGQGDYLYIVDTNLGANKANCCIDKNVTVSVSGNRSNILLTWVNNNEFENPKPPMFWGGDYRNYVRIVMPRTKDVVSVSVSGKLLRPATDKDFEYSNALRQEVSEDMYVIEKRGDLQIIGFWVIVGASKSVNAEIELSGPENKSMLLKHQPGSGSIKYQIIVDGKIVDYDYFDTDRVINF